MSMSQCTGSLLASLLLATLMGAPPANAVCRSPKNICKHIDDCLHSNSRKKDAEQIREGVRTRDGKMVFAGAEACSRDFRAQKRPTQEHLDPPPKRGLRRTATGW